MFNCNCGNELEHINYQFWFCGKCIKIIDLKISQNWENKDLMNLTFINNDVKMISHQIRRESQNDFIKIIPDLMVLEVF